ncbi:hypothetical protein V1517DRAFT_341298 [Lipomyces orientalis]|uniref:Uncharacterized protein n=1 Tax=Lipomyces orientalis TaxID=1233043 RepID=A0ACC3TFI1_9ASCO
MEFVDEPRANFRKEKLVINFEMSLVRDATRQKKRSRDEVSSPSPPPPPPPPPAPQQDRKRRRDHLQDQHTARLDATIVLIKITSVFLSRLIFLKSYNHGTAACNSIASGEATIQLPPIKPLSYWEQNQGHIK